MPKKNFFINSTSYSDLFNPKSVHSNKKREA